jgi:hypothetical protein
VETTPGPDGGTPAADGAAGPADIPPEADGGPVGDDVRASDDVPDEAGSESEYPYEFDDGSEFEDGHVPHEPLPFQKWVKRSATGAVLSGIAFGLQEALQPKRELPAFVMEAPGEPDDPDAPITLHFDPDDPKTVAVIRDPARGKPPGPDA